MSLLFKDIVSRTLPIIATLLICWYLVNRHSLGMNSIWTLLSRMNRIWTLLAFVDSVLAGVIISFIAKRIKLLHVVTASGIALGIIQVLLMYSDKLDLPYSIFVVLFVIAFIAVLTIYKNINILFQVIICAISACLIIICQNQMLWILLVTYIIIFVLDVKTNLHIRQINRRKSNNSESQSYSESNL